MSQKKINSINLVIPESVSGLRLDKYLGGIKGIESRSRAQTLIEDKAVILNGLPAKASYMVKGGESLVIQIPEAQPLELQPLNLKLEILFEDEHLIVLNKPTGLVVHPAAGHAQDTLVNALMAHSKEFTMKFGEQRPGIVHRLDKDTSGIMVVAKSDKVHEELSLQFKERSIKRYYLAMTHGVFKTHQGTITSFLARHPKDRKRYSSVRGINKNIIRDFNLNPGIGKWAQTDFHVLGTHGSGISYVKLKLQTGRTHQIRVHLSELGFPILGDDIYGSQVEKKSVARLALHAAELGFRHPMTNKDMSFQQAWPSDLAPFVDNYFGKVLY